MDTAEVVQSFYAGLARKDDSWQDRLSQDVLFADASGRLEARGRDAFVQSFGTFLRAVEKVELNELIVQGTKAAAVVAYDYVNPRGDRLHQADAELWTVEGGEIISLMIYFDITEFRAFMTR